MVVTVVYTTIVQQIHAWLQYIMQVHISMQTVLNLTWSHMQMKELATQNLISASKNNYNMHFTASVKMPYKPDAVRIL